MDPGWYPGFVEPMACDEPHPRIERLPPPGDGEQGRKFLTDLCLSANRLPEEGGT